jgi:hypothetical protein
MKVANWYSSVWLLRLFLLEKSVLFSCPLIFHSFLWSRICADKISINCRSAMLLLVSLQKKNNPVRFWNLAVYLVGNGPDSYYRCEEGYANSLCIYFFKIAMSNICSKTILNTHTVGEIWRVDVCTFWGYEVERALFLSPWLLNQNIVRFILIWVNVLVSFQSELSNAVCRENMLICTSGTLDSWR